MFALHNPVFHGRLSLSSNLLPKTSLPPTPPVTILSSPTPTPVILDTDAVEFELRDDTEGSGDGGVGMGSDEDCGRGRQSQELGRVRLTKRYFSVNYYVDLQIGKFNKAYQVA